MGRETIQGSLENDGVKELREQAEKVRRVEGMKLVASCINRLGAKIVCVSTGKGGDTLDVDNIPCDSRNMQPYRDNRFSDNLQEHPESERIKPAIDGDFSRKDALAVGQNGFAFRGDKTYALKKKATMGK